MQRIANIHMAIYIFDTHKYNLVQATKRYNQITYRSYIQLISISKYSIAPSNSPALSNIV